MAIESWWFLQLEYHVAATLHGQPDRTVHYSDEGDPVAAPEGLRSIDLRSEYGPQFVGEIDLGSTTQVVKIAAPLPTASYQIGSPIERWRSRILVDPIHGTCDLAVSKMGELEPESGWAPRIDIDQACRRRLNTDPLSPVEI